MKNYLKAVLAVVGAAVVAVHQLLGQGSWTVTSTLLVLLAVFGSITVYVVPNLTEGVGAWAKEFVALAVAGIETAVPFVGDGAVSGSEWLLIAMAVMTAGGVPLAPGPKHLTRGTDSPLRA
jgi:hypothetical protein